MNDLPFATKVPQPSVWGCSEPVNCSWTSNVPANNSFQCNEARSSNKKGTNSPEEMILPSGHYEYMPAVLLNSLKRDKKPFTYTPGRLDLSQVLNAKLQKRIERRRKASEGSSPTHQPMPETPTTDPQKLVLVMPTYNTPLNMYSMENAIEALEVQAELTINNSSNSTLPTMNNNYSQTLPRNYKYEQRDYEPKNVTQSKAFKVLQIITDTEEDSKLQEHGKKTPDIETRFTGIRDNKVIPSRFFSNLQKITHTEQDHRSSNGYSQPPENQQQYSSFAYNQGKEIPTFHPVNNVLPSSPIAEKPRNIVLQRPAAFLPSNTFHSVPAFKHTENNFRNSFYLSEGTDF